MSHSIPMEFRNQLLRSLRREDLARLEPHLEPVDLKIKDILVEQDKPIEHVYFVEEGIASVVTVSPAGRTLEVSNVGREGMTGISILFDVDRTPLRTFMQVAGTGFRFPVEVLLKEMEASPSLRRKLLRYAHTVMIQTSDTALALGHYTVNQRLARWILMGHDRADGNDVPLTHEFLALMLGVRRAGVSIALAIIEGEGMIRAMRGHVVVRDRAKLIDMAGGSYGLSEAEYARVLGGSFGRGDGFAERQHQQSFSGLITDFN
ncbi:Crp/Fnr family transcriptional regulator [Rhizobium redzepovicii]|uniref:Crp/Fnr family transcriptional regulator n=1 Tax=Rhizobium redzepovicii TaxID=2867518 RepID=UPI002870F202|nr:Crp/Fnr family transcriptional regulator [Rhizobium redzepovicii]MDR9780971.1 Crp/Fnr family transcriptional regulator [Rhizobium redzepovicii]